MSPVILRLKAGAGNGVSRPMPGPAAWLGGCDAMLRILLLINRMKTAGIIGCFQISRGFFAGWNDMGSSRFSTVVGQYRGNTVIPYIIYANPSQMNRKQIIA
ncbi:MAG: hypothetical protein PHQ04_10685 [Opitutaceae bacterium]|nr:hypothetical protein [Opitutaceae bacterium]